MSSKPAHGTAVGAIRALWWRELIRFFRQPSRLIGAILTPVVFWLLIGSGLGRSFRPPGGGQSIDFLEYALPGMLVLIVLFAAIFSNISTIEDRREGFLQSVLVSPVSPVSIALGKVFGAATMAAGQGLVFVIIMPVLGMSLGPASLGYAVLVALVLISIGLAGLGFVFAWRLQSSQGFHAVMNLVLMPMWLLSSAFFPASGASRWMAAIMAVNPLNYGVELVRRALYVSTSGEVIARPLAGCLPLGYDWFCSDDDGSFGGGGEHPGLLYGLRL